MGMKKSKTILPILLMMIALACLAAAFFLYFSGILQNQHSADTMEALRPPPESEQIASSMPSSMPSDTADTAPSVVGEMPAASFETEEAAKETAETLPPSPVPDTRTVNPYREAFLANSDMAAWLQIPDTNIDYPVMWTPEDENYYLYRAFDGSDNKNGCLILDTDSSLSPLTTNLIIHGHNMRSGAMFGNLTDYESKDYFEKHKQIILYTEECQRNYEVIAVFRSQVYKKTDQVFKFYKFFQADTEEEFADFYDNIKKLSLYDTGITAEFGDRFLTLSTCVYHVEQGRFVVVARETECGDSYLPLSDETQITE